MIQEELASSAI